MNGEGRGPGDGGEAERFWEGHHRGRTERPWDGGANPILIDVSGPRPAGSALDLGCGEGSDALWLARRGWSVTADVSATAQYLHSPVDFPRERVLRRAAAAVAPGGLLLIVDHASVAPWSWADPDTRFPTPAETLAPLDLDPDAWRTERLAAPQRPATGPNGETATVTDNAIAVRRLGA